MMYFIVFGFLYCVYNEWDKYKTAKEIAELFEILDLKKVDKK